MSRVALAHIHLSQRACNRVPHSSHLQKEFVNSSCSQGMQAKWCKCMGLP